VALRSHPDRQSMHTVIAKAINKMLYKHGKGINDFKVEAILEILIDTYDYETPETILLFLHKAGNGDFGKFFGEPDAGTLREWFGKFLESEIIPARERINREYKEVIQHRTGGKTLREFLHDNPGRLPKPQGP